MMGMAKTRLHKAGVLQRRFWPTPRACMGAVTKNCTRDFNLEDFVSVWEDEMKGKLDEKSVPSGPEPLPVRTEP